MLAGFLTLFAGFLMSEAPPEGVRDVVALGAVAVAAGVGNAGGAFVGNRLGQRAPLRVATGMLLLATMAAEATARATLRAVQAARALTTPEGLHLPCAADIG